MDENMLRELVGETRLEDIAERPRGTGESKRNTTVLMTRNWQTSITLPLSKSGTS